MAQKRPPKRTRRRNAGFRHARIAVREPQQDRSVATKERIIEAGFRLFAAKGLHATNSKEVVRAAGTGIGMFYGYFVDKKDLFLEILRRHRDGFLRSLQLPDLREEPTPPELRQVIGDYVDVVSRFHDEAPAFHQEAVFLRQTDPEIASIMDDWDETNRQIILALLTSMPGLVRLKDPEAASHVILRTIEDTIHFVTPADLDRKRLTDALTDCLYMYICGR